MGLTYIVRQAPRGFKHAVRQDGKTFCGKNASKWVSVPDMVSAADSCVLCLNYTRRKEAKYNG